MEEKSCSIYLKKYVSDFKHGLKSIDLEFPKIYDKLIDFVSPDGRRSPGDFPKLMKGGNSNAILKFLSFVIVVLAFYYGKNPIEYFNTSIGKTLMAAKSIETILHKCSNISNTEHSIWSVTLNTQLPEKPPSEERLLQIHSGIGPYSLATPNIIAMTENALKKANPQLNLPEYRKYSNAIIDVFTTFVLLQDNVLYINFEERQGTRCITPEFDQECNFFKGFKEVSSIKNTQKFISQNKLMVSILISKIYDVVGAGLFDVVGDGLMNSDKMIKVDSSVTVRQTSRGGGFHPDTTNANAYVILAAGNDKESLSTEFVVNPVNRLDFIGSNTLPHDIPELSPLRIIMPPYSTQVWKENGKREKLEEIINGKKVKSYKTKRITHHSVPNYGKLPEFEEDAEIREELGRKLTPRQVDAAMKLSNKDKEGRLSDESTIDNLDNRPQFVFSQVELFDPDPESLAVESVLARSSERQHSLYSKEFLKHMEEFIPTDFFPSDCEDNTLTIIIEGVEIPKGSILYKMIITAYQQGTILNELSKENTQRVTMSDFVKLFTVDNIMQTKERATRALSSKKRYKRLKGGKSLKKKRRTKKR